MVSFNCFKITKKVGPIFGEHLDVMLLALLSVIKTRLVDDEFIYMCETLENYISKFKNEQKK